MGYLVPKLSPSQNNSEVYIHRRIFKCLLMFILPSRTFHILKYFSSVLSYFGDTQNPVWENFESKNDNIIFVEPKIRFSAVHNRTIKNQTLIEIQKFVYNDSFFFLNQ